MLKQIILSSCLALSLAACATVPSVEVTRFHNGSPAQTGSIAVQEIPGNPDVGLEFRTYAGAVSQELQRVGFTNAHQSDDTYANGNNDINSWLKTFARFGELPPHYGFESTCTLEGSLSPGVFMCPDQYTCLAQVPQFTCFAFTKLTFLPVRITTQGLAQVTDCLTPEVS